MLKLQSDDSSVGEGLGSLCWIRSKVSTASTRKSEALPASSC